ncbi:hypothetical protein, partial [Ilyobacter sp.]|uniref:hypothetical protein n=1 Tax=Ilyobacter sp. TaxID=3100343 RepID=UPI00356A892D
LLALEELVLVAGLLALEGLVPVAGLLALEELVLVAGKNNLHKRRQQMLSSFDLLIFYLKYCIIKKYFLAI